MKENIIHSLRKKHGINQAELARRVGSHSTMISRWERSGDIPSEKFLPVLCEIFNVEEQEILSGFSICKEEKCRKKTYKEDLCIDHYRDANKIFVQSTILDNLEALNTLGERLRYLREYREYSTENLGRIFGVTDATIKAWESNNLDPSLMMIIDISNFFKVSTRLLEKGHNNIREETLDE